MCLFNFMEIKNFSQNFLKVKSREQPPVKCAPSMTVSKNHQKYPYTYYIFDLCISRPPGPCLAPVHDPGHWPLAPALSLDTQTIFIGPERQFVFTCPGALYVVTASWTRDKKSKMMLNNVINSIIYRSSCWSCTGKNGVFWNSSSA